MTLQFPHLKAQVIFTLPVDTIPTSQSAYSVPITVENFNSVVGAQFTLAWDKTVLDIKSIDNLGFEDLSLDNHFNIEFDSGWVNFLYIDLGLSGVTLEDDVVLFQANFEVIGLPGDQSELRFADEPTEREVTDTSSITTSEPVDAVFNNGKLIIEGATSTRSALRPDQLRFDEAFPNPFHDNVICSIFVKESDTYQIEVLNIHGQVIYQNPIYLASGKSNYTLDAQIFPKAGTYIIRLSGQALLATQKVLCTK